MHNRRPRARNEFFVNNRTHPRRLFSLECRLASASKERRLQLSEPRAFTSSILLSRLLHSIGSFITHRAEAILNLVRSEFRAFFFFVLSFCMVIYGLLNYSRFSLPCPFFEITVACRIVRNGGIVLGLALEREL